MTKQEQYEEQSTQLIKNFLALQGIHFFKGNSILELTRNIQSIHEEVFNNNKGE